MRVILAALIAAASLLAAPAWADDSVRRGGEWQTTVTGMTPQPQSTENCFAPVAWEKALAAPAGLKCSKSDIVRNGSQVTFDLDCDAFAAHGTVTLSGDSGYSSDQMLTVGSGADAKSFHATVQAKWLGACKPGEDPL